MAVLQLAFRRYNLPHEPDYLPGRRLPVLLFSREELRMHVHVQCADGEAEFWLEPVIELAKNYRLNDRQISSIRALIEAHANEFRSAWTKHFGG